MLVKCLVRTVLWLGVIALLLFVPAGTINWTGAWIFLIETFVIGIVLGFWLVKHDPELFKERMRSPIQKGQAAQDKIVTGLLVVLYLGWFAFMALDAVRFKWSSLPAWLQGAGALGVLIGSSGARVLARFSARQARSCLASSAVGYSLPSP